MSIASQAAGRLGLVAWSEALDLAETRMQEAVIGLREIGATVKGVIGDPNPMQAIADELLLSHYQEIILSTLPAGGSRWLKQDLPHRVQRKFGLGVTHIVADQQPVP